MAGNELVLSAFYAGTPILQVRDLRTNLLKPASLSLSAGECIAVRGPSGADKTLLLRAIVDLDPNEGLYAWTAATAQRSPDRNGDAWSAMCRPSRAGGRIRSAITLTSGRRQWPLSKISGFPRRRRG